MTLHGVGRDLRYETVEGWAVFTDGDVTRDLSAERKAVERAEAVEAAVVCFTPAERVSPVPGYRWDEHSLSGGPVDVGLACGRWFAVKLGKDATAWFAEFRKQYGAAECLAEEVSMLAWRGGRRVVSLPDIAWPPSPVPRRVVAAQKGEPGYRRFKARWGDKVADVAKRYPWPERTTSASRQTSVLVLVDGGHPLCEHAAELAEAGACMAVCRPTSSGFPMFRRDLGHVPASFGSNDHFSGRAYELVPEGGLIVAVGAGASACAANAKSGCGGRFSVVDLTFGKEHPFPIASVGSKEGRVVPLWTRDKDAFVSPFRGADGKVAVAYGAKTDRSRSVAASVGRFRDVLEVEDVSRADVFVGAADEWLASAVEAVAAMQAGAATCASCGFPARLPRGDATGVVDVSGTMRDAVAKVLKLVDDKGEREDLAGVAREAAELMHPQEVMLQILEVAGCGS
jgi:hypothetical protein